MKTSKKLIEVALPLDAINAASVREKSIRHGHPSTLHLWWARRPLAAARAVIFSQMVDDPSAHPDRFPTEEAREKERQRLFRLIEELVKWENTTNEALFQAARDEIRVSWQRTCTENADHPQAGELFDPDRLPAFHDPFAGGGALPLEAQRLGLEAHASDLNPVAVLINKAMIEIPPKFAGRPPVNPEAKRDYLGARASRPLCHVAAFCGGPPVRLRAGRPRSQDAPIPGPAPGSMTKDGRHDLLIRIALDYPSLQAVSGAAPVPRASPGPPGRRHRPPADAGKRRRRRRSTEDRHPPETEGAPR